MTNVNETTSAFTPGPWVLRPNGEIAAQTWVGKWDDYICRMPFGSPKEAEEMGAHQIPNARLIAEAPDLLRIAESAANAFKERIASLKQELLEDFCDVDDTNDQIDNYKWLLNEHRKVIARVKGAAA